MNRREFFRMRMTFPEALLTGIIDGRARRFGVRLVDLSGGGALTLATRPLYNQDPVRLHLPASPEGGPLDLPARVVHVKPALAYWQLGLRFTSLSEATREEIVRRVRIREEQAIAQSVHTGAFAPSSLVERSGLAGPYGDAALSQYGRDW